MARKTQLVPLTIGNGRRRRQMATRGTKMHLPIPNLDNSRRMKEKSHRAPQGCDKSGDKTLPHSTTRRLDGDRLYTASHVRIRSEKEAGGRRLRRGARQLRRRRDLAQGDRYPARADQGLGRV